jgi:hypothetical protein
MKTTTRSERPDPASPEKGGREPPFERSISTSRSSSNFAPTDLTLPTVAPSGKLTRRARCAR